MHWATVHNVLILAAVAVFVIAAFDARPYARINLMPLGLALLAAALYIHV